MTDQQDAGDATQLDAVVVGAGFGGLYMLYRLRELGFTVRCVEAGSGVGGTWYWNRYPGARCDVESLEYCYAFSEALLQEWRWTERYAGQPEILRYLEHVAERLELYPLIDLDTRVTAMRFDAAGTRWQVETNAGPLQAQFCIMATGCLSVPNVPDIAGLDEFRGELYHTGRWPKQGVSFGGKRVGVIGTGSSAIQSVPVIAEQAARLTVFQRTPNYSVPARNHPLDPARLESFMPRYADFRRQQRDTAFGAGQPARDQSAHEAAPEERRQQFDARWRLGGLTFVGAFSDLLTDLEANETAAAYVRERVREIVRDPETAERLCPDHAIGCKRLCSDSGYYEAFNRDNVSLVDLRDTPIDRITATGVRCSDREHGLDILILASGFDAMTGALARIDITGRNARRLADDWESGAGAYLGLAVSGYPNLFLMTGPGSPSVLANMVTGLEQHAEWISNCLVYLRERGLRSIEACADHQAKWMAHVAETASGTVFTHCNSWYVGANVPGKPRTFLPYIGGFNRYEALCSEIASDGYAGFGLA